MPRYSLNSLNPRLPGATSKVVAAASRGPIARAASKALVAGETLDDAIRVTGDLTEAGHRVSWMPLLRPAGSPDDILTNTHDVTGALSWLSAAGTTMPDLTIDVAAFGVLAQDVTPGIILNTMREVGAAARNAGVTLTLTILEPALVEAVYVLGDELRQDFPEVGIVLPTRLRRLPGDLSDLAKPGRRVRLTTGRLDAAIGMTSARESGNAFVDTAKELLSKGVQAGFDTDDALLLDIARALVARANAPEAEIVTPLGASLPRRSSTGDGAGFDSVANDANVEEVENSGNIGHREDREIVDPDDSAPAAARPFATRVIVPYGTHVQPYVTSLVASRPSLALSLPNPLKRKG